ncbi:MAG: hypothetical protein A2847_02650 [Candidatus Sungbacteria bacterium RIFCSPHIGHO2_01_FULL_50_25]|uniref:Uncharacterized protein n=1 Tax=Candidatus Sungbacteria bacterium RIFCSPHIGHO2_01_FULL_50_25 TaxID=1802265 RepID=A0A1G2K8I9_9BACT|nr:MAG: hypothetical protein A2847_02650 [Candidatus Sungbacteria bacterium RIFCSPHIGHO2_01_FULL_50_25]
MQISFHTTPKAKEKVLCNFGQLAGATVIPTHDGAHVTVHAEEKHEDFLLAAYTASSWPGVEKVRIILQNLG